MKRVFAVYQSADDQHVYRIYPGRSTLSYFCPHSYNDGSFVLQDISKDLLSIKDTNKTK